MKRFIVVVLAIFCICTEVFAYNYDAKFKKEFYDEFIANFFQSMQEGIIKEGFKDNNTYEYISTLRARLDRTELENASWGCVTKYSVEQMRNDKYFSDKCFGDWSYKFIFEKNSDTLKILKK